jgi:outer membrane immunogenic protein
MKILIAAGTMSAAVIAGAGLASAGDIGTDVASASVYDGFYLGVTGGYVIGEGDFTAPSDSLLASEDGKADLDGGMIGGLVGYDYSFGNGLVVGVVGDMSWLGAEGDVSNGSSAYSMDLSVDWLGTLRGRVGFELGDALIYGTGGMAFGGVESSLHLDGTGEIGSDDSTQIGWTLGVGANYMLSDNIMLGVEYLYVDLGEATHDYGADESSDVDVHMNLIRGSVGFKF